MRETNSITGKTFFKGRNNRSDLRSMAVGEKVYFRNRKKLQVYWSTANQMKERGEGEWSVYWEQYEPEGVIIRNK